jgi:DNA-binding Lrp family transcriptional regulator
MGPERDEYSGRYNREFELSDFVSALQRIGPTSTSKIAEEVGCSRDLAYLRLKELEDEGNISGELIGGNYRWSVVESGD